MIVGANYREGVAIGHTTGAVHVLALTANQAAPAGSSQIKGATPLDGKAVDSEGRLLVRFV